MTKTKQTQTHVVAYRDRTFSSTPAIIEDHEVDPLSVFRWGLTTTLSKFSFVCDTYSPKHVVSEAKVPRKSTRHKNPRRAPDKGQLYCAVVLQTARWLPEHEPICEPCCDVSRVPLGWATTVDSLYVRLHIPAYRS